MLGELLVDAAPGYEKEIGAEIPRATNPMLDSISRRARGAAADRADVSLKEKREFCIWALGPAPPDVLGPPGRRGDTTSSRSTDANVARGAAAWSLARSAAPPATRIVAVAISAPPFESAPAKPVARISVPASQTRYAS